MHIKGVLCIKVSLIIVSYPPRAKKAQADKTTYPMSVMSLILKNTIKNNLDFQTCKVSTICYDYKCILRAAIPWEFIFVYNFPPVFVFFPAVTVFLQCMIKWLRRSGRHKNIQGYFYFILGHKQSTLITLISSYRLRQHIIGTSAAITLVKTIVYGLENYHAQILRVQSCIKCSFNLGRNFLIFSEN